MDALKIVETNRHAWSKILSDLEAQFPDFRYWDRTRSFILGKIEGADEIIRQIKETSESSEKKA